MYDDDTEMRTSARGGGFGRALKNLVLFLLFLGLAFGLLYLVAERNARRYFLVPEDGNLVVKRGIFFPIGQKPYLPDDPSLAKAYAPIPLPASGTKIKQQAFAERSDLDRSLFDTLLAWSKTRIHSGDPKTLEKGIKYLSRAEELPTYTDTQRQALEELQGEVAYYEAKRRLRQSVDSLEDVVKKLARARDSGSARAGESKALLGAIEQHIAALRRVLDELDRGIKLDSGSPPTPPPADTGAAGAAAPATPPAQPALPPRPAPAPRTTPPRTVPRTRPRPAAPAPTKPAPASRAPAPAPAAPARGTAPANGG